MLAPNQYKKPSNWQDFEMLCKLLWGEVWGIADSIKRNGRQGQNQHGQLFAALLHWFGKYTLEIYVLHLLLYVFLNGILESRPLVVGLMVAVTLLICKPVHELTTKVANWMIR